MNATIFPRVFAQAAVGVALPTLLTWLEAVTAAFGKVVAGIAAAGKVAVGTAAARKVAVGTAAAGTVATARTATSGTVAAATGLAAKSFLTCCRYSIWLSEFKETVQSKLNIMNMEVVEIEENIKRLEENLSCAAE